MKVIAQPQELQQEKNMILGDIEEAQQDLI
jgi:hypothetical protein